MVIEDGNGRLDTLFGALANGVRRRILEHLLHGEATVTELTDLCNVTMPSISRHLSQLGEAGLVERRVEGRKRWVRLVPGSLEPTRAWLRSLPNESGGGSLADYLKQLGNKE
ncbi:MAG: metalloregulator ArsR/SmtB family transcription factor [bacterium]